MSTRVVSPDVLGYGPDAGWRRAAIAAHHSGNVRRYTGRNP